MPPDWSRRSLLGTLGAAGFAGLSGCPDSTASARGATDVVVHNHTSEQRAVDVTVTGAGDDSPAVDDTFDLAAHASRTINNRVVMDADYEVRVTMTGPSVAESGYSETLSWTDAGQPLHVMLDDQIVFAVQVG